MRFGRRKKTQPAMATGRQFHVKIEELGVTGPLLVDTTVVGPEMLIHILMTVCDELYAEGEDNG